MEHYEYTAQQAFIAVSLFNHEGLAVLSYFLKRPVNHLTASVLLIPLNAACALANHAPENHDPCSLQPSVL